jgi:IclR family pca regulon transcriptional regulator
MVQSVERAFSILRAVAAEPLALTSIAAQLELPKSTVARLLGSLEELEAVERVDGTRWGIGPALAALAGRSRSEAMLAGIARPVLEELVIDLGEDAGIGVPDGDQVRFLDQVNAENAVLARDWTGTRAPLYAVPSGLLFLGEWPESGLDVYLAGPLTPLTRNTVTEPARVRARVAAARAAGHAWGREELVEGVVSVAAPIRDRSRRIVAALHLYGPAYRFPPRGGERAIEARVREAADTVSGRIA